MEGLSARSDGEGAEWTEVEQAFFDAAPPDEPAGAPAHLDGSPVDDLLRDASPLDDLPPVTEPPAHHWRARLRLRWLAARLAARAALQQLVEKLRTAPWSGTLTRPRTDRRAVAMGLASAILSIGLSAGVVASRSGGGANAPAVAPAGVPAPTSADAPAPSMVPPRASATPRPQTHVAKHPDARATATTKAHHEPRQAVSKAPAHSPFR